VGTGSGILSIAAAKLWPAATGHATDVDPIAVGAAAENLEQNQVKARVTVDDQTPDQVAGTFDLVIANIQADVLLALCGSLVRKLAPGGTLLLSGLLSSEARGVGETFAASGLRLGELRQTEQDKDWASVRLTRPA
jgi:ribosomal protein L11 methyltransferase